MRIVIAAFVFTTAHQFAYCQEIDLERCHELRTDSIRLTCYDNLSDYTDASEKSESENKQNKQAKAVLVGRQWRYADEKSALDSRRDVWLSVASKNTEGNNIGSATRAFFYVRCMQNSTNTFVAFDRFTSDNQNVQYRLDDGPVQKQWMEAMRSGDGIGIWSGTRAIPFVKRMFEKQTLVVSYNTFDGPVEFSFDISGLRSRIEPLAESCNWTP